MSTNSEETLMFVLHCEEDDSHILVDETMLLVKDASTLKIDDSVNVHYPGCKGFIVGTVRGFSRDYRAMEIFLKVCNKATKPKRNVSFHDGQPRLSKLKGLEKYSKISKLKETPKPVQKIDDSPSEKDLSEASLQHEGQIDEAASSKGTVMEASDSSDSDISPEMLAAISKLRRRGKLLDIEAIQSHSKPPLKQSVAHTGATVDGQGANGGSGQGSSSAAGPSSASFNSFHGVIGDEGKNDEGTEDSKAADEGDKPSSSDCKKLPDKKASDSDSSEEEAKRKRKRKRSQRSVVKFTFNGEFYRHPTKPEGSTSIVEVYPKSGVYVSDKSMKEAKKTNSASAMARVLIRKVFTAEARAICSTSGKPSFKTGSQTQEIRTALKKNGVQAILDCVTARASKKRWPTPTESNLKQSIGNMLSDARASETMGNGSDEEEAPDGQPKEQEEDKNT